MKKDWRVCATILLLLLVSVELRRAYHQLHSTKAISLLPIVAAVLLLCGSLLLLFCLWRSKRS